MDYRLQKYEDGTYGYLGIDGDEDYSFTTESPVVCTQGEDEDREEFIAKNGITFSNNQYGSNEKYDKVVNFDDLSVKLDMIKRGYGLDKFINDEDGEIRAAVAEQGYGLNRLIYDGETDVRAAVARQGYGLDILVYDENYRVCVAVAEQGYGLDILIKENEGNRYVRDAIEDYLEKHNITLADWLIENT